MRMYNHYLYMKFENKNKYNYGPLIRYNIYLCWLFYKYCVYDVYRMNYFRKLLNILPMYTIVSPKSMTHIRGHRSIHNIMYIFLHNTNIPMLQEYGFETPDMKSIEPSIHNKELYAYFCKNFNIVDKKSLYKDIVNIWEFVDKVRWI